MRSVWWREYKRAWQTCLIHSVERVIDAEHTRAWRAIRVRRHGVTHAAVAGAAAGIDRDPTIGVRRAPRTTAVVHRYGAGFCSRSIRSKLRRQYSAAIRSVLSNAQKFARDVDDSRSHRAIVVFRDRITHRLVPDARRIRRDRDPIVCIQDAP